MDKVDAVRLAVCNACFIKLCIRSRLNAFLLEVKCECGVIRNTFNYGKKLFESTDEADFINNSLVSRCDRCFESDT